ncbi:MAG: HipA N-terminal domain-containing protein, partial [Marinobacter sp.]
MSDELGVHVGTRNAGKVFQETKEFVFRYYETALPDQFVSLTMPVRKKDYNHPR